MYIAVIIFCAIQVIVGVMLCFFGYRLLRGLLTLCGFLLGSALAAIVLTALECSAIVVILGAIIAGLIVGVLARVFYVVGIFLIGAQFGASIAVSILLLAHASLSTALSIILICVLALVGGILAVKLRRVFIIISTAYTGGTRLAMYGWTLYLILSNNITSMSQFNAILAGNPPGTEISMLLGIGLAILGMILQFARTAPKKQIP